MSHLSDDELVLRYYGEGGPRLVAAERHLQSCVQCARACEAIARSLNAVTTPDVVDPPDDLPELRQMIRARAMERSTVRQDAAAIALVWLMPLVYPFSIQVLFDSGRLAHDNAVGFPLVLLSLMWACAGPLVAVLALNRTATDDGSASTRVLVAGGLIAATSPSLFLLVSRVDTSLSVGAGLWTWYGVITLASLVALIRWPTISDPAGRFRYLHRLSALVLTVFVLAHIVNQAFAFVSLSTYTAMRSVMRLVSVQPATYTLIAGAVAVQLATGAAMSLQKTRGGAMARNLQVASGWSLAAFLLVHVFGPLIFSPPQPSTAAAPFNQFDLLATPRSAAQLPYLLLGVAAFLFHLGLYTRLAALAYFAEASVRRLSYAGMLVGTTVVVTVGLALCGVHLTR